MPLQTSYLYLRGLRQVDHTVFCVADGQKTYYDPVSGRTVPYSSGQQVKHSILDQLSAELDEMRAPVTFNWKLPLKDGKRTLEEGEAWSACDPAFADQLIGGWMKASKDAKEGVTIKRRSPLSISAMRPLHPTLSGLAKETGTFDRSNHPEQHRIRVTDAQGNEVSQADFLSFLQSANRTAPMRKYLPDDQMGPRASGLFVYDVAVDLRTLFSVSLNTADPEITSDTMARLKGAGWQESKDGTRLICPDGRRQQIVSALAHSLIHWRITSNQSRTYSPQNTLAFAISRNANRLGAAIRAELTEESEYKRAEPVLDALDGVSVYTALTAKGYIREVVASTDALEQAEADLAAQLLEFNYDV